MFFPDRVGVIKEDALSSRVNAPSTLSLIEMALRCSQWSFAPSNYTFTSTEQYKIYSKGLHYPKKKNLIPKSRIIKKTLQEQG